MPLDPTKHADWEIAEAAETGMKTVYELGEQLGLQKEELLPHGHYVAKLDFNKILGRLKDRPDCKYVDVTQGNLCPVTHPNTITDKLYDAKYNLTDKSTKRKSDDEKGYILCCK